MIKKLKFFIIFINGGILSLTDSHHNHHGQKPTMVGICHGGNVLVSRLIHTTKVKMMKQIMGEIMTFIPSYTLIKWYHYKQQQLLDNL